MRQRLKHDVHQIRGVAFMSTRIDVNGMIQHFRVFVVYVEAR